MSIGAVCFYLWYNVLFCLFQALAENSDLCSRISKVLRRKTGLEGKEKKTNPKSELLHATATTKSRSNCFAWLFVPFIVFQWLRIQGLLMWVVFVFLFLLQRRISVLENALVCQNVYECKLKKVMAVMDQQCLVFLPGCLDHEKTLPSASQLSQLPA